MEDECTATLRKRDIIRSTEETELPVQCSVSSIYIHTCDSYKDRFSEEAPEGAGALDFDLHKAAQMMDEEKPNPEVLGKQAVLSIEKKSCPHSAS